MSLDINVNVYHCHDLSDSMRSFVMGLFEDLSAQIAALKQATSDEHTEGHGRNRRGTERRHGRS
jgi:hypothetical protein